MAKKNALDAKVVKDRDHVSQAISKCIVAGQQDRAWREFDSPIQPM